MPKPAPASTSNLPESEGLKLRSRRARAIKHTHSSAIELTPTDETDEGRNLDPSWVPLYYYFQRQSKVDYTLGFRFPNCDIAYEIIKDQFKFEEKFLSGKENIHPNDFLEDSTSANGSPQKTSKTPRKRRFVEIVTIEACDKKTGKVSKITFRQPAGTHMKRRNKYPPVYKHTPEKVEQKLPQVATHTVVSKGMVTPEIITAQIDKDRGTNTKLTNGMSANDIARLCVQKGAIPAQLALSKNEISHTHAHHQSLNPNQFTITTEGHNSSRLATVEDPADRVILLLGIQLYYQCTAPLALDNNGKPTLFASTKETSTWTTPDGSLEISITLNPHREEAASRILKGCARNMYKDIFAKAPKRERASKRTGNSLGESSESKKQKQSHSAPDSPNSEDSVALVQMR